MTKMTRYVMLALALVVLLMAQCTVDAQQATITTYTYDSEGNLVSEVTEPVDDRETALTTEATATSVEGSNTGSTAPSAGTNSSTDSGPMTISTNAPTQTPITFASPSPQSANSMRPLPPQTSRPVPTPAPQPVTPKPLPTVTPQPVTTPKPQPIPSPQQTQAPQPAVTQATPAPQPPQQPAQPTQPTQPGQTPQSTDDKKTNEPPAPTTKPPSANNDDNDNDNDTPTPVDIPVGTVTAGSASAAQTQEDKESSKEGSSTEENDTAKPLSDEEAKLANGGRSSSGGGSWGTILAVAGVICAIVGVSGFVVMNRKRQQLEDSKDNVDFESCSATPMDGHNGAAAVATALPKATTAPSPQRVSYKFTRASAAVRHPQPPSVAIPPPINPSTVPVQHQAPRGTIRFGPSNGSILEARESSASDASLASDASFMNNASVAPPLARPSNGMDGFKPTPSFMMRMTMNKATSHSITSSNMEYEFSDDSNFQPVARTTDVARRLSKASVSSSFSTNLLAPTKPSNSYDYDDELSDDDVDDEEVNGSDEDNAFNSSSSSTGSSDSDASFAQAFYEPRDDSYSDDYARTSSTDSAIRSSCDSLFSRSSSEFSERRTDDSLV